MSRIAFHRVCLGAGLWAGLAVGCRSGGEAQQAGQADCVRLVERAQRARTDSLFADAVGLIRSCPDAMAITLAGLWRAPAIDPDRARHLRAVSAQLRDDRLALAVLDAVRNPALPIVSRVEALSTISYSLVEGRWIEFTFLKEPPDSASLRVFLGLMDEPPAGHGSVPVSAGYGDAVREALDRVAASDSSAAVRHAARRFLVVVAQLGKPADSAGPAPRP